MKRIFVILTGLILGGTADAATSPEFFNAGTIATNIRIDAVRFHNIGTFTNIFANQYPWDMQNVRFVTNRGSMHGSLGFKFDTIDTTLNTRRPLSSFFNSASGNITATDEGASFFGFSTGNGTFFGTSLGVASYVDISATNLVNNGTLSVGSVGLLELKGKNVDLTRGTLTAGQVSSGDTNFFLNNFFSGNVSRGFFIGNSYVNAFGVEDIYWGAGPDEFTLPQLAGQLFPPFVVSPQHQVQVRSTTLGGVFGLIQTLPTTFPADFEAFCNIEQFGTNKQIQVVFLKTNFTDTNISAAVRFGTTSLPPGQGRNPFGLAAMVEFSTPEFDPVTDTTVTNAIYFLDGTGQQTNMVLLTNALSANSVARPSGYEIATAMPFEWVFAQPANDVYDPTLIYPGDIYREDEADGFYAGYAAKVGRNPEVLSGTSFNTNFFFGFIDDSFFRLPDPTNQGGRIEINADTLNVSKTRIRTEGLLSMNAKHLQGVGAADVSAGIINADLGSTNGFLVISNVFPSNFKRVRGDLFAYSAIWSNVETNDFETNRVRFHILILDHDLKADFKPTIRNLTLRSTNLVVKDDLTVVRNFRFISQNLTLDGTNTFNEDAVNVTAANFVGLRNFLNESNSVFQGANNAFFGWDTAQGLDSFTNRGLISATAPLIKANLFHNSGTITAPDGGSIIIQARTADLSNGILTPDRDLEISAGSLTATNSFIAAGGTNDVGARLFGRLILNVTNSITDLGPGASNFWQVSDGFILPRRPFQGDLKGTEIRTISTGNQEAQHIWAGLDVGPGADGYFNNVALGRLVLEVLNTNSTLRFTGAGSGNALYVNTLDFEVGPGVDINADFNELMTIDNNMRIYFINSNSGEKLTNAFPGRVIQVPDFGVDNGELAPLAVTANGLGIITPNLHGKKLKIGDDYLMKARPGAGQIFKGWSGGTNSSEMSLTFKMKRNLALQANFVPNPLDPMAGSYNGLFYDESGGVSHETAGFLSLQLRKKGAFSGKILLGKTYPFHGAFMDSGSATVSVRRANQSALLLNLQMDLTNNTDQLLGTVTIDGEIATLVADRANAGATQEKRKYTMVVPGGDLPAPEGDGIGTVDVDAKGGLHFKGTLADGTPVHQRVSISKNGEWPLYLPLYRSFGSVWGRITFTNETLNSFQGDVNWFKKSVPGRNYQNGFTNVTTVIGSAYSPAEPVLGITTGTVTLSGGNLSDSITNEITLGSNNAVTVSTGTNLLKIKISLPTGLLNGTFAHPDTKKTTTIKGVVLQQQNSAHGFFLGTNQSGSLILEGN